MEPKQKREGPLPRVRKCTFSHDVALHCSSSSSNSRERKKRRRISWENDSDQVMSEYGGGEGGKKTVGVAMDFSACSKEALKWAVENLVREGDHVILVNVQKEVQYEEGETQLWEATGSPFIPLSEFSEPSTARKYGVKPDDETRDFLNSALDEKEIVIVMKIYYGDPREKILEAIDNIPLSCLVIGSRGLSRIKRVLLGSVSNYVVDNGSCPITVVGQKDHPV